MELQWSQKSAREANDLKILYEAQLERLRQEQLDEAASLAERDARLRIVQAEDKVTARYGHVDPRLHLINALFCRRLRWKPSASAT